ncbi:MAG TPA: hypothetical protein VKA79_10350 [Aestuariivirgaceae bacterium]|jgi:hypothetical protein|nr:hypothetical protein [Aestuariivirgaceae bacterium]
MADSKADLSRQAVKNLSDTRDDCIRALATGDSSAELIERLETLIKVQAAIDIIKRDIGPSR